VAAFPIHSAGWRSIATASEPRATSTLSGTAIWYALSGSRPAPRMIALGLPERREMRREPPAGRRGSLQSN